METFADAENKTSIMADKSFGLEANRKFIDNSITNFEPERSKIETRRKLRLNIKNVYEEQQRGTILKDETIIEDRTININIKRARVSYVNYTTRAKNTLILKNIDNPGESTDLMQEWFTTNMRYDGWKQPWLMGFDGLLLHGGVAVEIVYNPMVRGGVSLECIPREDLCIPEKCRDIQAVAHLPRRFDLTTTQIVEYAALYGFDQAVVDKILDKEPDREVMHVIYRILMKKRGIVYNVWYWKEDSTLWLRKPQQHTIGLFDFGKYTRTDPQFAQMVMSPEWTEGTPMALPNGMTVNTPPTRMQYLKRFLPLSAYPIFWIKLDEIEEPELLKVPGRAALDVHTQEALTHLITNTVNASTRASHFYPTRKGNPGDDPKLTQMMPLKPGLVTNGELSFFQPAWPNVAVLLGVAESLRNQSAQSVGKADYASMARKDANKTATEMEMAASYSNEQEAIELTVFSLYYQRIYNLCLEVNFHQAIMQLIEPPTDLKGLFVNYATESAGDVEVVKRAEEIQNAEKFFEIVKGTPAAAKLLSFLFQRIFPDQAADFVAALNAPDKDQIILQLANALAAAPRDGLSPEQLGTLDSLVAGARSVAGTPADAAPAS